MNMAKSGIAVKTLQYLMGHADIATTLNVYAHLKLEDAKGELEQMKVCTLFTYRDKKKYAKIYQERVLRENG